MTIVSRAMRQALPFTSSTHHIHTSWRVVLHFFVPVSVHVHVCVCVCVCVCVQLCAIGDYYYVHTEQGDLFKVKGSETVASVGATFPGYGAVVRIPGGLAVAGAGKFGGGRVVIWTDAQLQHDPLPLASQMYEIKDIVDFRPIGGCYHSGFEYDRLMVQLKTRSVVSIDLKTGKYRVVLNGHVGDVYALLLLLPLDDAA